MRVSGQGSRILLIGILWAVPVGGQDFTISTIAGGVPPQTASVGPPRGVAVDAAGNAYFSTDSNCVFKLDAAGALTVVAGNSRPGYSGDGGPAVSAQLNSPRGVAVDGAGNLYIADHTNHRVRRVTAAGIITTFAGTGVQGFSGDGGPATAAQLSEPAAVAVDGAGNVYIADSRNNRVRRVAPSGVISTVAGSGPEGFSGDNGPATSAQLWDPSGVAVDGAGNLYIADSQNNRVRAVASSGVISTVAGPSAGFRYPGGVAVDGAGLLYIADTGNHRVLRAIGPGLFTPVAGTGDFGYSGDGGVATSAHLNAPEAIAVPGTSNLYIADTKNNRIRRVELPGGLIITGAISTVAGDGTYQFSGDGGQAASTPIQNPLGVAVDGAGNLYFTEFLNNRVRRVAAAGVLTTVAGYGTSAPLDGPSSVALDTSGNLYIASRYDVRRVSAGGLITTVAGNGIKGFSGDGGPAVSAQLGSVAGVALDAAGNLYIADRGNQRIRLVTPAGVITTVAGNGVEGYSGDGAAATSAQLHNPFAVAVDAAGSLYIADSLNDRVRRVSGGIITTVAGSGAQGFGGDGGPAASALLFMPTGVAVDGTGNLLIADYGNDRIRRVSPAGTITTLAGNGVRGYAGDGGPATSAQVWLPNAVAADNAGRVYFATWHAIRMLTPMCTLSASPNALTAPPGGGTLDLAIQATPGCGWTITGLPSWITASATSGSGPAAVTLTVDANWIGATRSATITAAGTAVTIGQSGGGGLCVLLSLSPLSQTFSSAGGTGAFTVAATAGCGWTAVSQVAWITITSGASGSGNGAVNFQVLPNPLGASRSGTIGVVSSTFTVEQDGAGQCGYSINSADLGVVASGGTVAISLHTDPGCAWSISGLPSWLTVSGSSQGTGSANVSLVAANNPAGTRSASISIGGVSVPIRQFDTSACGGSGSCTVRALPHIAAGADWATALFAANLGMVAASFSVDFYGDDGSSLALPFAGGGNLSTLNDSVPAQGRRDYEAGSPSLPLQAGWGLLIANSSATVQATFRRAAPNGIFYEAAVPATGGYSAFIIPFDASTFPPTGGALYTGFAISNLNPIAAANVTCIARDQWGAVIPDAVTIPALSPSGHYAGYLFPPLTGKRGMLDCTADTLVSAIALRSIGTEAFSTLPVIVK
jgi:sugar lactone lactonase YvrE